MLCFQALWKPMFSTTLLVTLQLYLGQSWRISGPTSNKSCSRVYQSGTRSMSWLGRSSTISPRVKGSLWQPTKRFCCTFDKFELGVFWTHTGGRILSPFSLYSTRKYRSSLIREQPPPDDVLCKFWELESLGIKDKTGQDNRRAGCSRASDWNTCLRMDGTVSASHGEMENRSWKTIMK